MAITQLNRLLDDLIQFGISIGTAKRVLRDVRSAHPGIPTIRAEGNVLQAAYASPSMHKKVLEARGVITSKGIKPPFVYVPKPGAIGTEMNQAMEGGMKEALKTIPKIQRPAAKKNFERLKSVSDPLMTGLHEHGHISMPDKLDKMIGKMGDRKQIMVKMTHPFFKQSVGEEYRANRTIKGLIEKHGTPEEVKSWVQRSQDQIKVGYRNPIFQQAVADTITNAERKRALRIGRIPMSAGRRAVKEYPWVRKQELSEILNDLIQFKTVKWEDNPLYPEDVKSTVQDIPINQIVSHQNTVKRHIVEEYKKKPGRFLPEVHKVGSKYIVEDGNHRIVAKKEKGEQTVRVRVFEKTV